METEALYVKLPKDIKYRLDRHSFETRIQLKDIVAESLDKTLPHYEENQP